MGPLGVGEWDCFGKMLSNEAHHYPGEGDGNVGLQSMFYSFDSHNSNLQHIFQENSHNSVFMANLEEDHTNYHFGYVDHVLANSTSMGFCMLDEKNPGSSVQSDIVMKENVNLSGDEISHKLLEDFDHSQVEPPIIFPAKHLKLKRNNLDVPEPELKDKIKSHGNGNKKPRVSKDVQHCMKNQKLEKSENHAEEIINAGSDHGRSSSSYIEEDDNSSQANSGGATSELNLKGKTKVSRGSATDPQSLYARKRRERINERLRILQNLVPNGTKVDISTMLEEAVQYVKFLQLQIKLLSSDDLWMYAPIAYNGLDLVLNLNQKSSPPL